MKTHIRKIKHFIYGIVVILFLVFGAVKIGYINPDVLPYKPNIVNHNSAFQKQAYQSRHSNKNVVNSNNNYGGTTQQQYNQLASLNFKSGASPVIKVNNNKSTLNPSSWTKDHVIYQELDNLNRTSGSNTAFLDRRNVVGDSNRTTQYVRPTGWHQKFINHQAIINRGHIIAYSLTNGINQDGNYQSDLHSGNQNDLKNLFTQTAFSNRDVQTKYEQMVRSALYSGKKVIYQGTPIFQGDDLMPKGINLQAVSTDGSLNFNVYLFNIQPGVMFNYTTGHSRIDRGMQVNWYQSYKDF